MLPYASAITNLTASGRKGYRLRPLTASGTASRVFFFVKLSGKQPYEYSDCFKTFPILTNQHPSTLGRRLLLLFFLNFEPTKPDYIMKQYTRLKIWMLTTALLTCIALQAMAAAPEPLAQTACQRHSTGFIGIYLDSHPKRPLPQSRQLV